MLAGLLNPAVRSPFVRTMATRLERSPAQMDFTRQAVIDPAVAIGGGIVGMRDFSTITYEDGRPVLFDGKIRLTATASTTTGFTTSTMFIVEVDPVAHTMTKVGSILTNRGGVKYDHAGQIILLNDGTWQLLTSQWGGYVVGVTSDLHVLRLVTSTNISEGDHTLSGVAQINLPHSGTAGCYDPNAVKVGSTWYVTYAVVDPANFSTENFYVALATTTDFSTFSLVGADTTETVVEGPRIARTNDDFWVIGGGRGEQPVWDLTMTKRASAIAASPGFYTGTRTQPWMCIFPWGEEFFLVTWDGTKGGSNDFTWGQIQIYTSPRYTT